MVYADPKQPIRSWEIWDFVRHFVRELSLVGIHTSEKRKKNRIKQKSKVSTFDIQIKRFVWKGYPILKISALVILPRITFLHHMRRFLTVGDMFINTMFSSTFFPSLLLSAGVHHVFNLTSTGCHNKYQNWGKLSKLSFILKMKIKNYKLHFVNPRGIRELKCLRIYVWHRSKAI